MPGGGGDRGQKNDKKKSKAQLDKDLKKGGSARPVEAMTFEVVKPKRKERF